ncbi:DUF2490 domain-containing protein [Croceitalea vernalis]|uniref:DUF2490 domain-containing protein n=1 Tax=Croceitalea vernalis TaxID=3075599 RepID=A0ABU3BD02_9FLAO|nr:DUF2490 domain-containing protein [Croceitalea sp. P007]MDT0620159.1 DUF2490 domain-containing protein [Croceitalea sp. P007]
MTMYFINKKTFHFLAMLLPTLTLMAQENFTGYWQSSIALNYGVAGGYSHNFSIKNRNYIYNNESLQLNVRQIDFAHFSNYKIQDNQSLALGILYRSRNIFEDGIDELRLTQQYNLQSKPYVIRYGHRLRSEQRLNKNITIHRFRYRFSLDFPLKGEKLNVGEPYFVGNIESLLSVAKMNQPQYDTRLTAHFGWQLTNNTKLQIGSEYRLENFSQNLEHIFFFLTTLNFSL